MSEFATSFHQLTAFTIPQLAAFLQLRYRSNDQKLSPFATHPTTMFIATSSFMLYYLLYAALLRSPTSPFAAVAQHFLVWAAYAAVSTLAAALFPDRAGPYLYAIFGLLSAGEVLYMFGNKLVIEDENEDEVEDEDEKEEALKFEVYKRRVHRFLKCIHTRWGSVAKFFRKQNQPPILPT